MGSKSINWFIRAVFALGILLIPFSAAGQASNAVPISGGPVVTPYNTPAANAPVRVCAITAIGNPCSTAGVTLYADYNLTQPINNPTAANSRAVYNAFTVAGFYLIQIQATPTVTYSYYYLAGGGFTQLTGDVVAGPGSGSQVATVKGLNGTLFCTGFSPTNGEAVTLTTASTPDPCWTALMPSGGYPGVTSPGTGGLEGNPGSGQTWEIFPNGTANFTAYQVNGSPFDTGNLGDWTDTGIANGLCPVWNSTTSKWTPGVCGGATATWASITNGTQSGSGTSQLNTLPGTIQANAATIASLSQTNSAEYIQTFNGGSGYTSNPISLTGGTCSTPLTIQVNILSGGVLQVFPTSVASCTVAQTVVISGGGGTGAAMTLALASNAITAASGSGVLGPTTMNGGGDVAGSIGASLTVPNLVNPVLSVGSELYTPCSGSVLGLLSSNGTSGLGLLGGCGTAVNVEGGQLAATFATAQNGNETLWGGNVVMEPWNSSYNDFNTLNEGIIFNLTGSTTISFTGGNSGSGYTGAGTCSLAGGIIITGSADTCTATLSSGGIVFTLAGTATYSLLPYVSWSGATGGSGAIAPQVVSSGTPVLTGSAFMDPTSTFHVSTATIPNTNGITAPGVITGDLFAVGPGVAYLPPAAPSTGGPDCLQIAVGGRITNTGSACGSGGSGGSSVEVNGGSTLSTANFANNTGAGEIDFTNPSGSTVNATLHNTATTVNSQTCTLGSSCTVTATATNALTMNNSNGGAASGTTYNGSAAETISTNTIGAPNLTTANAFTNVNTFTAPSTSTTALAAYGLNSSSTASIFEVWDYSGHIDLFNVSYNGVDFNTQAVINGNAFVYGIPASTSLSVDSSIAATSSANQNSPYIDLQGSCWNGSVGIGSQWAWYDAEGPGTNGTSTLTLDKTSSCSGTLNSVSIPYLLTLGASTTTSAPFNIPQGTAPTSPNNGDVWTTSAGMYGHFGGTTVGPFGTGGSSGTVTSVAETVPSGFAVSGSPITGSGTLGITYSVSGAGQVIDSSGSNAAGFTANPSLGVASTTSGSETIYNSGAAGGADIKATGQASTYNATIPALGANDTFAMLGTANAFTNGNSITTAAGSSSTPLTLSNSLTGSQTLPTLEITPTWNTTGNVNAGIDENVTDIAHGTNSFLLSLRDNGVSVLSVSPSGVVDVPGTVVAGNLEASTSIALESTNSTNAISASNLTAATSSVNQSSPLLEVVGQCWNGTATASDVFSWQDVIVNGPNPRTVLTLGHDPCGAEAASVSMPLTSTATSGTGNSSSFGESLVLLASPTSTSSANYAGLQSVGKIPTGNAQTFTGGIQGGELQALHEGSGTVAYAVGSENEADNLQGGTITAAYATIDAVNNTGNGTITNAYGTYVYAPTNSGGGTLTNFYGVYINTPTAATNNYALYDVGGAAYFGGSLESNAEYNNGTCTTALTVVAANGNRQKVTLTNGDTCALTFTQPASGTISVTLKVIQSSTSSYNGTISGCKWPGGTVPTITATTGAVDFVSIYMDGTNAYCAALQNFQ